MLEEATANDMLRLAAAGRFVSGRRISDAGFNDERTCCRKSDGLDTRCRLDDDASGETDETGNCEEWTGYGQTVGGLLDKVIHGEGGQTAACLLCVIKMHEDSLFGFPI